MDPLSIIASIIAVAEGTERLVRLVSKARRIKEAPVEVHNLLSEVSQAKSTLSSLQDVVLAVAQRGAFSNFGSLNQVLHDYAARVHEIETFVEKHLITRDRKDHKSPIEAENHAQPGASVSRWGWAIKKSQVEALREKISNARQLILAEMAILSSSLQLQMQSSLEDRLDRQEKVLNQILLVQHGDTTKHSVSTTSYVHASQTPAQLPEPRVQVPLTLCRNCTCQCHISQKLSVTWSKALAGAMCLGTTGNPFLDRACNLATCKRPSTPMVRGVLYLPHWIASRVILFNLVRGTSPSFSLNFVRIVSADSELFRYIQMGRSDKVQDLLETGQASPGDMIELPYGTLSALFFALNSGQVQVCKVLLSWGADPDLEHDTSLTSSATNMAWNMSHEGGISPMVNRDDRLENIFPFPRDFDHREFPRLTKILLGLSGCDLDAALKVATAADFVRADCNGRTVTHWAGWKGDAENMRKVLLAGADPDVADPAGRTPLHFSSMTNSSACTEVLAQLGADVNIADNFGETPLHCACSAGRQINVAFLLSAGADINTANLKGKTALMSAVLGGSMEVIKTLLSQGVDVEATDAAGESAATLAIWVNDSDILRALVSIGGASLDVVTFSGRTIIHTAAQYGDIHMIETLLGLDLGTNSPAALNHEGLTAMEKLHQRKELTQELTEAFGALLLKMDTRLSTGAQGVEVAFHGDENLHDNESSSDTSEEDFLPALESYEHVC